MKIVLIRHFKTKGNLEHRYVGTTDEELLPVTTIGYYEEVEHVYVSPLKRCIQTMQIIYPKHPYQVVEAFKECDFGDFEYKNYLELSKDPDYQAWIDANGMARFPNGEFPKHFKMRCQNAFLNSIQECINQQIESVAFVVHGGTIMSIMECFANEQKSYYDYQVKNGAGFVLNLKEEEFMKKNYILYKEKEIKV